MSRKNEVPQPIYVRSETDIFKEPGIDVSLQSSGMVEYHPVSNLSDNNGPITFNIKGNDVHYLDCSQMLLYVRGSIVQSSGDGTLKPYAEAKIAPVNNLLHSLFQQCTVHLNETQITPNSSLYAYRSYIETELAFGGDYKNTQGRAAMYIQDAAAISVDDAGFKKRNEVTNDGQVFDMIGKPCIDICAQTRYIIPGIDMRVAFHRSPDDFYMHSATQNPQTHYHCKISEARLLIRKHTLLPVIQTQHLKLLESGFPAIYPMRRVDMKTYSLPIGTIQNTNENIISGILPDRLILGLVPSENLNGTINTTPFSFFDYSLNQITVTANGEQVYSQTYNLDAKNNRIAEVYYNMFNGLGLSACNEGPNITMYSYKNGKFFFVFNLRHINDGICLPRHGNIKIELKFAEALTTALNVVCHVDYQSTMYIDNKKSVYFKDFSTLNY